MSEQGISPSTKQLSANAPLVNINVNNIQSSLVPDTANTYSLGSALKPYVGSYTQVSNLYGTSNQIIIQPGGSGNTTTITSATPAASRVYTIPDAGATASFAMTQGTTTIAGTWTFSAAPTLSSGFTISSILSDYAFVSTSSTFTAGGLTSGAVNITTVLIGKAVIMSISPINFTVGGSFSSNALTAGTAIPSKYRPLSNNASFMVRVFDNGSTQTIGEVNIDNTGIVTIYKDAAHNNYTAAANAGTSNYANGSYYII